MVKAIKIKRAERADIPIIFNFIKQLAEHGKLSNQMVATEEVLEKRLFSSKVYAEVILGYIDQKPVGFAMYSYSFSTLYAKPILYLVNIFVEPDYRHQGIANKLLVNLAQIAKEQQCCRIEWSAQEWNSTAIKFYNKIGAEELSDWRIYRMSDGCLDALANQQS